MLVDDVGEAKLIGVRRLRVALVANVETLVDRGVDRPFLDGIRRLGNGDRGRFRQCRSGRFHRGHCDGGYLLRSRWLTRWRIFARRRWRADGGRRGGIQQSVERRKWRRRADERHWSGDRRRALIDHCRRLWLMVDDERWVRGDRYRWANVQDYKTGFLGYNARQSSSGILPVGVLFRGDAMGYD